MGSPALSIVPRGVAATVVNDIHSQLNATRVDAIVRPRDVEEAATVVADARRRGKSVSIAGGRHAMGGQQFGEASVLVDTRGLDRVLAFDAERGIITVEGGIMWPAVLEYLERAQRNADWADQPRDADHGHHGTRITRITRMGRPTIGIRVIRVPWLIRVP